MTVRSICGVQVPILCKSHFDEGSKMPSFEAMSFDFKVETLRSPAFNP